MGTSSKLDPLNPDLIGTMKPFERGKEKKKEKWEEESGHSCQSNVEIHLI